MKFSVTKLPLFVLNIRNLRIYENNGLISSEHQIRY